MRARSRRSPVAAGIAALLFALVAGCELAEVTLTENVDLVVAEVLVQVRDDRAPGEPSIIALLHRTSGAPEAVPGARVVIHTPRRSVRLMQSGGCAASTPPDYGTTCYRASAADETAFLPDDQLELEIELQDGGRLTGSTRVPGDFRFRGVFSDQAGTTCRLAPDNKFDLRWSLSQRSWAYVAEAALEGFQRGFAARDIDVPVDFLYMLGLSTSAADTTIVFPSQFGLLERFSADRDLLVALQRGLPEGTLGRVSVAAVERNYTNWARGGTFNPSGQVRIPSVRGDGTGFFGAAVVRRVVVVVPPFPGAGEGGPTFPPCG